MKQLYLLIACAILLFGCQSLKKAQVEPYPTLDYVTVGKQLPNVETPYVIDLKKGDKRLVFIGCSHSRDTTSSEFSTIEAYFNELQPQVSFHEGGQLPATLHFESRNEAIAQRGETGLLKYLADQAGIPMLNGDITDSLEFTLTLQKYPKQELFLYYMMERLMVPYLNKAYGNKTLEELYPLVIDAWFVKPGFPLSEEEKSLAYFRQLYQEKMGRPFVLEVNEDNFEKFDYINGGDCPFCAIGRTSKMVRDKVLLDKIDKALDQYDRVLVTFGHGHALAVEPALKQIMDKARK